MNEQEFNSLQPGDELIGQNPNYKRIVVYKDEIGAAYILTTREGEKEIYALSKEDILIDFTAKPKEKWVLIETCQCIYDNEQDALRAAFEWKFKFKSFKPVKIIEE